MGYNYFVFVLTVAYAAAQDGSNSTNITNTPPAGERSFMPPAHENNSNDANDKNTTEAAVANTEKPNTPPIVNSSSSEAPPPPSPTTVAHSFNASVKCPAVNGTVDDESSVDVWQMFLSYVHPLITGTSLIANIWLLYVVRLLYVKLTRRNNEIMGYRRGVAFDIGATEGMRMRNKKQDRAVYNATTFTNY